MKASELRIGNYIILDGEQTQVDQIGSFFDQHMVEYINSRPLAAVKPIPLTPEWLERFGFERVLHDERDWYNYPLGLINPLNNYEDHGYMMSGEFDLDIRYVHQLQNLYFALTGEELTIKEPVEK